MKYYEHDRVRPTQASFGTGTHGGVEENQTGLQPWQLKDLAQEWHRILPPRGAPWFATELSPLKQWLFTSTIFAASSCPHAQVLPQSQFWLNLDLRWSPKQVWSSRTSLYRKHWFDTPVSTPQHDEVNGEPWFLTSFHPWCSSRVAPWRSRWPRRSPRWLPLSRDEARPTAPPFSLLERWMVKQVGNQ